MNLIINTANRNKIIVAIGDNKNIIKESLETSFHESEKLIPLIKKVLKKAKKQLKKIKKIIVVTGPGPFTSLRIGIGVANALALSLNIAVVGFKKDEFKSIKDLIKKSENKKLKKNNFVKPFYDKKPNITKPKKPWLK
ncbi:MAG: tRNA (adenosine(37)-N6)-threonylcarbamoyltransferase complex dimerization subunit type 1 TsaB [Patescibacteria group bacterium]|nr:tRNA (adenosine(37)-N6)-threonylcarbamoyltransferase complex dimerization subunit type 1 TsaB [Patescibacteria group bacterium]